MCVGRGRVPFAWRPDVGVRVRRPGTDGVSLAGGRGMMRG